MTVLQEVKLQKSQLINRFQQHEGDTGSPEVQIALLTRRIDYLNDHFKAHAKDHASRRGLLKIVGKRRRLLDYLKKTNRESYQKLIGELGIRK